MNIFARALGGLVSDKVGKRYGRRGKGLLLAGVLLLEGLGLLLFAQAGTLVAAITAMLTFALFLKMSNGATYGIVPFVNQKNVGLVSGIVGAGGNLGGMLFGFLFKSSTITYADAFTYIGYTVVAVSVVVLITRFKKQTDSPAQPAASVSMA
jgi:NNP family nitrate/nitrite transporter-like MFS transporter